MSRQQRLEAEADVSTSYGSLDLHRLFSDGSTREGSASTTSFGAEEEAVALAAFNGDLLSVVDAKMANKKRQQDDALENRQQPSNAVDPASLPPLVVIKDGGSSAYSMVPAVLQYRVRSVNEFSMLVGIQRWNRSD